MWTERHRSCTSIYTHPDIILQVVVYHNLGGQITWGDYKFDTVEQAKTFAEEKAL